MNRNISVSRGFVHRLLIAAMVSMLLAGCAGKLPPAPQKASSSNYSYEIGPGDQLNITVWRNPELSAKVPVRPDGKISTPLIGDVSVTGRSAADLATDIEERLEKYVRDPKVTVVIEQFEGVAAKQIRVIGQVAKPMTVPYRQNMSLLDVMLAVGGLTEYAAGNRAVLIRSGEKKTQYNVRLNDLLKSGDVSADIEMLPGDVIVVPNSWF
ncbi:MAG: polysaccharide export protein [Burkholderiaceae bacterium]